MASDACDASVLATSIVAIFNTGSFLAPPLEVANHSSSTRPSLFSSQRPPTLPHSPKVTTTTQYRSYLLNQTPSGVVSPNTRSFLALWRNLTNRPSSLIFSSLCPQFPLQLTTHSRSLLPSVLAKFHSIVHTRICSARCQPSIRNPYFLQSWPRFKALGTLWSIYSARFQPPIRSSYLLQS